MFKKWFMRYPVYIKNVLPDKDYTIKQKLFLASPMPFHLSYEMSSKIIIFDELPIYMERFKQIQKENKDL